MFSGSFTLRRLVILLTAFGLLYLTPVASQADHANPPGPVNAGTTYGWGKGDWMQHWEGPSGDREAKAWKVRGKGYVRSRYGMLTLRPWRSSSIQATLTTKAWRTGRWEIRLRARRFENVKGRAEYKVKTELVPAYIRHRCGARNIALEKFRLPSRRARIYARNVPNLAFVGSKRMNLRNDLWHTFAVEVRRTRITWYIDGHAYRTERRPKATHGKLMTVRFKMQGVKGKQMNKSWMQMDWIRYFDFSHGRSGTGPRLRRTTYSNAC